MSELPKGWRGTLLNGVVDKIVGGGTPSKSVPSYYEGDIPWMTVKDMNKSYLTDTIDHITQEAIDNSSTNVIPAGTPIIATRMSLGKIVRASFDSAINQDLKALFVNREVDDYYFEYWYRSQGLKIESLGTGTTVKGVRLEVINALEFPLAPLAEQKRIVEKLDEVLAQVDTIKARLDGIPDLLKRFRQSVLASAVSGKLTEEWRGGISPKWEATVFSAICNEITVGFVGKMKDKYTASGVLFLRSQNVRAFRFDPKNVLYISEDFHDEIRKSRLEAGDLAIVRSGAPGTTCVIPENLGKVNCSDLVIARPSERLNPKFGCIFMNSEVAQKNVASNQVGIAQQHFNVGSMKKMAIELPSLAEQKEIVRLVDQYFAFAETIEAQVKKAQARVDNLTQSILAKAFRGELVAQDPNDEPADKLLERIAQARAEAEALAKAAKKAENAKKRAAKKAAENN